ncbi:MAG TPA: anthranilate phosphoribosyltransferase, partial [bacterium]|nr:anthranilate phosphoribosyltransferase [bacterium]
AAAGVKIAKHGNRSVSSGCGSADILAALGVNIEIPPEKVAECIDNIGIGFMFAPKLHNAMKYAMTPRREMGIRTVFNILGPLSNPANADYQLLGVYDEKLTELLANVLLKLGIKAAYVVHGADGLDEITLTDYTTISELKNNVIKTYKFNPIDYGFHLCNSEEIKGGTIEKNLQIVNAVLDGKKCAATDIVIINSAFAIMLGGREDIKNLHDALELAKETIYTLKARKKLNELIAFTNS